MKIIPYGKQSISEQDIASVIEVLRSDYLTQGEAVPRFESDLRNYVGADYAIAVNSATSALHIACLAMGLGSGDELWTSPISFVASANCALYCGAKVDFVDIDPDTYNMCPDKLEDKIKSTGKIPKIVVPVHLTGQSCDMLKFRVLADKYGFFLLEDASHAIGASYLDGKVGSCQYSDAAVFSFHPVKIITTGEGGAITTNNPDLYNKIVLLRSHGITRDQNLMNHNDGPWYYEQLVLGYNYRLTDIQAALGSSQLHRLDDFVQKRHEIAAFYNKKLDSSFIKKPQQAQNQRSSFHLYAVQVENRGPIFTRLRESNIGVNVHYIPIYLQPYYKKIGFTKGYCMNAESYYQKTISLPIYPDLTNEQQLYVINQIHSICRQSLAVSVE